MHHCLLCARRLFPWQSQGNLVRPDGSWMRWHGSCWELDRPHSLKLIAAQGILVPSVSRVESTARH